MKKLTLSTPRVFVAFITSDATDEISSRPEFPISPTFLKIPIICFFTAVLSAVAISSTPSIGETIALDVSGRAIGIKIN